MCGLMQVCMHEDIQQKAREEVCTLLNQQLKEKYSSSIPNLSTIDGEEVMSLLNYYNSFATWKLYVWRRHACIHLYLRRPSLL
jgi:hypothetical protein